MSVVHDCIARQLQAFDIPALPACPGGKCVCGWFWVHKSVGGTDQMYMTGFQCNVTNPSKRSLAKSVPPVRCDGQRPCYLYPNWGNITNVCPKAKQPIYWANNERNNVANPTNWQCAPTFNVEYGFADGAQKEIFADSFAELPGSIGDTLFSSDDELSLLQSKGERSSNTLLVSPSSTTKLVVQEDGDVVLSDIETGKVYWSSNTAGVKGVAPYHLTMQKDGNLVLADDVNTIFWSTNTANMGTAPYRLKLRDVVSLSVVDSNGYTFWSAL